MQQRINRIRIRIRNNPSWQDLHCETGYAGVAAAMQILGRNLT